MSDEKHICPACSLPPYICGHYAKAMMAASRVSTTCARCSATIDPAAVEQHHERCFVVGDAVRWWPRGCADNPDAPYVDGKMVAYYGKEAKQIEVIATRNFGPYDAIGAIAPGGVVDPSVSPGVIRHIQRPGQAVRDTAHSNCQHEWIGDMCVKGETGCSGKMEQPTLSARLGHLKHGPGGSGLSGPCDADCRKCEIERNTTRAGRIQAITELAYDGKISGEQAKELLTSPDLEPPASTLYDGLDSVTCWLRWRDNRAYLEHGGEPLYEMTPAQIAEAKAAQHRLTGRFDSMALRARISAAKERERLTVRVDDQGED